MEENKNIQEEKPAIGNEHPDSHREANQDDDSVQSQPVSEKQIPLTSEQPETKNLKPETENMEVHHHGHVHEKKKWKEYIFQFFMLFLAVFCGFLAEYQLEHKIERDREKQYMRSMIKDLGQDLSNIEIGLAEKELTLTIADSLNTLLMAQNFKQQTSFIYYYARKFSTFRNNFYMTDGTLTQLKNSGGLRLIRKQQLVDSLQAYDNSYQEFELDQELEGTQLRDYRDIMIRIFDVRVFDTMLKSYPEIIMPAGNPVLFNNDPLLINEFLMRVHLVKRNKLSNNNHLIELREKATRLIQQVKKEYHLD